MRSGLWSGELMPGAGPYTSDPAPARDVSAANWVVEALQTFGESVLSLVPAGFSSYVRVFHPAWRLDDRGEATMPVRWADVALAKGTRTNPGMQFRAVMGAPTFEYNLDPQPGLFDAGPQEGSLDRDLIQALAAVLARHTATPGRCWFAIWDGYAGTRDGYAGTRAEILSAPRFHVPARDYHLLVGPVAAAEESALDVPALDVPVHQSPNLWWPDDRAWFVATEIDLDSTYVGCTDACCEAILETPELESFPIDPASGIDWYSDPLNPSPPV